MQNKVQNTKLVLKTKTSATDKILNEVKEVQAMEKLDIETQSKEINAAQKKHVSSVLAKKSYLSNAEYNDILDKLAKKYPNVFNINDPKILAIGINKEIKADKELDLTNKKISSFLARYCKSKQYRIRHIEGADRYNLKGELAGIITNIQASKVKDLQEKLLERKKEFTAKSIKEKTKQETTGLAT